MPIASIVTLASGLTVPVMQYNSTVHGEGFYVSHNDRDVSPSMYGAETTALVLGQMEKFYILNGDHREAYTALIGSGYEACLNYFKANLAVINKRSEQLPLAA